MTPTAPVARTPETALEIAEEWHDPTGRRLRAAAAVRDDDRVALRALLEAYLFTYSRSRGRVSEHTLRSYRRGMNDLLDWCNTRALKAHHITREDARLYALHLEERGSRARGPLKPASVNARLAAARSFIQALIWAGLVEADPFARLSVRDPIPVYEKREPFTVGELSKLLDVATARERAILLLGADAGLRISEVTGLTWGGVQLDRRRLVVASGKGGKRRTVGLTPGCAEALTALQVPGDTPEAAPVFGISRRRIAAVLVSLCRRAGVPYRSFHSLRHSAGTRMYEATRDVLMVARHLGHAHVETARIYAHLAETDYIEAVERMAAEPEADRPHR